MRSRRFAAVLLAAACAAPVLAQPPSPVKFTEILNHEVRQSVSLPGSVESRTESVVASEAAGLVIALDVRPGDVAQRGEPLARLRDDYYQLQLDAARGTLAEARARLELAKSKLHRAQELFEDDVIAQDALDDAFSERVAWQGRVDATEAQIGQIELSIDRSTIRAPFTGVVTEKLTDVGQWIERGGSVVRMLALDELEVVVEVPERFYPSLVVGTRAEVTFEALPGHRFDGRVSRIIPSADVAARTFPVKVRVSNDDRRIAAGMLASVGLPLGRVRRALLVPKDAVVRSGGSETVYRIKQDDTVEPVSVVSGQGFGAWVAVEGELAPGERVVTRGNERLRPGQLVSGERQGYAEP